MKELSDRVCELAAEEGLADTDTLSVYSRVHEALRKEFGDTAIDSGIGGGALDFWVRAGGMEYKVVFKLNRAIGKPQ